MFYPLSDRSFYVVFQKIFFFLATKLHENSPDSLILNNFLVNFSEYWGSFIYIRLANQAEVNGIIYYFGFSSSLTCNIRVLKKQNFLISNLSFVNSGRNSMTAIRAAVGNDILCIQHQPQEEFWWRLFEKIRSEYLVYCKISAVLNHFCFHMSFQNIGVEIQAKK